jgi:beta-galactosidase
MRISANKDWKFSLGVYDSVLTPSSLDFNDEAWRTLDLPHDWQIENNRVSQGEDGDEWMNGSQGFYPRNQCGWYRYRFSAPLEWKNKHVCIRFDGVQRFSTVFLNGKEAGGRPYGYIPFGVCLDAALNYGGENILTVKVDNTKGSGDRWYSGAGIYRNVYFTITEKVFIPYGEIAVETLELNADKAIIKITAKINNISDMPFKGALYANIAAPQSSVNKSGLINQEIPVECPAGGNVTVSKDFEIKEPVRWDIDSPNLYALTLKINNYESDIETVCFGLRETIFDNEKGFFLNGKIVKMNGVCLHHDGGAVGAAVPVEIWRYRFQRMKEFGINAIRCSHNPQAPEFYDLADKMGFLLIDEIYDKWAPTNLYYGEFFDEWWERDIEDWVKGDRNHPSVILWSVGNEIGFQYEEQFYETLTKLRNKVRSIDASRPVSAALISYFLREYNEKTPLETRIKATLRYAEIVDVLEMNYMEPYYAELKKAGLNKLIIGSEVHTYYRGTEGQNTQIAPENPWHDLAKYDSVIGSFLWAGIDYLGESIGWPSRGWAGSCFDTACFPKLRSWFLASQWKKEPVLKIAAFDENEPYDFANDSWSFPQMRRHWSYKARCPTKHIAAMTNCDLVKIYLNEEIERNASPGVDGIAHFWIPFRPGVLRAEGYRNGEKVIEDVLRTSSGPSCVEIIAPVKASCGEVVPVEIWLKDKFGESWVLDNPSAKVSLTGGAELVVMDNGDLCSPELYAVSEKSFWNGHILAIIRMGNNIGRVKITVETQGMQRVSREIQIS